MITLITSVIFELRQLQLQSPFIELAEQCSRNEGTSRRRIKDDPISNQATKGRSAGFLCSSRGPRWKRGTWPNKAGANTTDSSVPPQCRNLHPRAETRRILSLPGAGANFRVCWLGTLWNSHSPPTPHTHTHTLLLPWTPARLRPVARRHTVSRIPGISFVPRRTDDRSRFPLFSAIPAGENSFLHPGVL